MLKRREAFALVLAWSSLFHVLPSRAQTPAERQVTLFGIIAVPGSNAIDPKLETIAPQLRKLLPGYGFKLLETRSERLATGGTIKCDMKNGFVAQSQLTQWVDPNGKVQLRFTLNYMGIPHLTTVVISPPNQLSFCEKRLPDGSRLLVGIGAR